MEQPDKNEATLLLRLPTDLKAALMREAHIHGRRITAEVNIRLKASLQPPALRDIPQTHHEARESGQPWPLQSQLSDAERVLISLYKRLSPEKQLALLSLIK